MSKMSNKAIDKRWEDTFEARAICWELGQASGELIKPPSFDRFTEIIAGHLKKAERKGMLKTREIVDSILDRNQGVVSYKEQLKEAIKKQAEQL